MSTLNNTLYPIFLKLDQLNMLIVGGGNVCLEKLTFILKSSPEAGITVVAPSIKPEVENIINQFDNVLSLNREFQPKDVFGRDLVIAATEIRSVNEQVRTEARKQKVLVNVADTPSLCDFYLGSIVSRGDLKIAISTNGKSPTFAKRFRQLLENALPKETTDLLVQLHHYRNTLTGDFKEKVRRLNELTKQLLTKNAVGSEGTLV